MILDKTNCSNPRFYGKELVYLELKDNGQVRLEFDDFPSEFYFDKEILGFEWLAGLEWFKKLYV